MESLTRLVSESLARHGFERPLDYRRLRWSRWFRCESHHSLLSVPSKPGVFALAEEVMNRGRSQDTDASPAAEIRSQKPAPRMLAVTKFFEDDDMAFTLDRMLSWQSPMRARLQSGRYFIRYVIIEEQAQRRSICNALNHWIVSSSEIATGIGSHFATSLELTASEAEVAPDAAARTCADEHSEGQLPQAGSTIASPKAIENSSAKPFAPAAVPQFVSGTATDIHCPSLFPSGF